MRSMTQDTDSYVKYRRFARFKRWGVPVIALAAVVALALLQYFCPLQNLLLAYAFPELRAGEMRVHFLDIGQGDCTVAEFPDGEILVVDGGGDSRRSRDMLTRYIKGIAPSSITLLLTHADGDHFGGMAHIIQTFGAKKLYLPVIGSDVPEYKRLLDCAASAGCETETLSRYGAIRFFGGAYAVCISPYSVGEENENESSAVLWMSCSGVNFLLGGDISASRERLLLAEYAADETIFDSGDLSVRLEETDILKVSHHGSGSSSSLEWLSLLGMQTAIVSCGRGNAYSHPAGGALQRIKAASPACKIYRTDELGCVLVNIANGKYTVLTDYLE